MRLTSGLEARELLVDPALELRVERLLGGLGRRPAAAPGAHEDSDDDRAPQSPASGSSQASRPNPPSGGFASTRGPNWRRTRP